MRPGASPQQTYAYTQPAPSTVHPAGGGTKGAQPTGKTDMFAAPHWRDLWAAVLFYANSVAFVVLAGYFFTTAKNALTSLEDFYANAVRLFFTGFLVTLVCAGAMAAGTLYAMKKWPKEMLHGCYIAQIVLFTIVTVVSLIQGRMHAAFCFGIVALLVVIVYFVIRTRLAFSAVVLRNVVECFEAYPAMLAASGVAALASTVLMAIMSLFVVSFRLNFEYHKDDIMFNSGMLLYFVFSTFWTQGVINNTLQTTVAGVYATWYFLSGTTAMVENPTVESGRRALTYSFGSVCIGSLIVAIIKTIRFAIVLADGGKNSVTGAIFECIVNFLENLAQTFNYYAYTMIAIYGKPYVQSAKDTWRMLSTRGLDVVAGDNFVGTCTLIMSLAIGVLAAGAATGITALVMRREANFETTLAYVFGMSFFYALFICFVVFEIVDAGATATFVCLAEDPEALRRSRPEFYNAVRQAYPNASLNV